MLARSLLLIFALSINVGAQSLDDVIDRAGKGVERFGTEFSGVKCTENLTQLKLDEKGKPIQRDVSSYDYVAIINLANGSAKVEESVLQPAGANKKVEESQFVTAGFATLILIFHPKFRANYIFTEDLPEQVNGRLVRHIRFEHKSGTPSTTAFRDHERIFAIDWKGDAWIDPETGAILRIQTRLKEPIVDLGLQSLEARVEYSPVKFPDEDHPYWLPTNATVDLQTTRQHWQNTQVFSDYRKFTVTARQVIP